MTTQELHERLRVRFGDAWARSRSRSADPFCSVRAGAARRAVPVRQGRARPRARLPRGPHRGRLAEAERDRARLPPVLLPPPARHRAQGRGRPHRPPRRHGGGGVEGGQLVRARGVRPLRRGVRRATPTCAGMLLPDDWVGHPLRKDYQEAGGYHGIGNVRENPLVELRRLDDEGPGRRNPAAGRPAERRSPPPLRPHPPRRPEDPTMEKLILRRIGADSEEMILNFGPQHPSTHGVINFLVETDGEVIRKAIPDVGYLHRSIEKIGEAGRLPRVHALHRPRRLRGGHVRQRGLRRGGGAPAQAGGPAPGPVAAGHLLRAVPHRLPPHLGRHHGHGHRRLHAHAPRRPRARDHQRPHRGAVRRAAHLQLPPHRRRGLRPARGLARPDPALPRPLRQVPGGVRPAHLLQRDLREAAGRRGASSPRAQARDYGLSGPNLRGSGVDWDIRRDLPYGAYPDFQFEVPVGRGFVGHGGRLLRPLLRALPGDGASPRGSSARRSRRMPEGEFMAKVPRRIKPEAGEAFSRVESARGRWPTTWSRTAPRRRSGCGPAPARSWPWGSSTPSRRAS